MAKIKDEESGIITSNNPNTVLDESDQKILSQKFENKLVLETVISECNRCGTGDITLKLEKCPDTKCGGSFQKYNMLHNRVTGAWKKEPVK